MFAKTNETFGSLDIVCNNAGTLNETDWEKLLSINLVSELSSSLVPRLSGGDSIATPAFQHPRIIKSPPESLGTRLVVKLRDSSSSPAL